MNSPASGGTKRTIGIDPEPGMSRNHADAPAPAAGNREADLVRRLQARDPLALGDLYDRFAPAIYGLALRLAPDVPSAEDLTLETFLFIWNRIGTFDATSGTLARWVLQTAGDRALDYLNSAELRQTRSGRHTGTIKTGRRKTYRTLRSALKGAHVH